MTHDQFMRYLKAFGMLVLLFVSAYVVTGAVAQKRDHRVQRISVEITPLPDGRTLFRDTMVRNLIERSFGYEFVGQPVGRIDVERTERVLERNPLVDEADVFLNNRNELMIRVSQREPVLRVMGNNGLNYYLDAQANKLPLSDVYAPHVRVASGHIPPHVPDFQEREKYTLKDVYLLNNRLQQDPFLDALVEQIYVGNNGELTLIPKLGDEAIRFGRYTDVEDKLWRLKGFYKEGLTRTGWRKYSSIDLRYDQQVVAR